MDSTIEEAARKLGRSSDIRFDRLMPSYHEKMRNRAAEHATPPAIRTGFLLIVLKCLIAMALIAAALFGLSRYYGDMVAKGGHSTDTRLHKVRIGSEMFAIPENMIRFGSHRQSTVSERIDLYLHWPTLEGYTEERAAAFDTLDAELPVIFVSLEPRQMSRDMSGRVQEIYEKFFSGPPVDAGHGLVRRAFSSESAYFMEDLYYEPDSPYPYAIRCIRESDTIADPFCIRDIHIGKATSATYRFHSALLPDWLRIDQLLRKRISAMIE